MSFDAKEEHGTGQRFIRSSRLQKKKKKICQFGPMKSRGIRSAMANTKKKSNKDINLQKETLKQAWICRLFEKKISGKGK